MKNFRKFAGLMLAYTILVILWGAWVRISHSGDGCGDSWPLCNGRIIPEAEQGKTWVEYGHRMMSGAFGLFMIWLFFWARKVFPKKHPVRTWATASLIFTITEALLGAKLVIFGLVTNNDSPLRAFSMGLHLLNSLLLTASISMVWDYSRQMDWKNRIESPWASLKISIKKFQISVLIAFLLIAVSGGIAALSSTLFPSESLLEGFMQDLDPSAHYLLRLRGIHPLLGLTFGLALVLTVWLSQQLLKPEEKLLKQRAARLAALLCLGILFGILTLAFLYPLWMKIGHLLLAHVMWITLVLWIRPLRQI